MDKWLGYMANYHNIVENSLKIKGKYKIKFDNHISNNSNKNREFVEMLEKLNLLYKSKVLTKEEFIKAKEKLINQYN